MYLVPMFEGGSLKRYKTMKSEIYSTLKTALLLGVVEILVKNPMNTHQKTAKRVIKIIDTHQKSAKREVNHFTSLINLFYSNYALAKSNAEPENSNKKLMANNSTPLIRAFFVCSTRTPKIDLSIDSLFSMVACNGKGFALCCVPLVAVSQPVTRYRPKPENLQAVAFNYQLMELLAMIYQFLGISRQHYDKTKAEQIRILAENETQARAFKAREYVLIPVGRLPDSAFNANTFNALEVAHV